VLYTLLYIMPGAIRTQIYLTADQRRKVDARMRRDGQSLAHVVREALDAYLGDNDPDVERALDLTFGSLPDLVVPGRDEWDRG
jgi:uridine kinase